MARFALSILFLASSVFPQGIDRPGRGEAPALVAWQRSLGDALALAGASGRPLLVVVNVDGEAASEIFAREKYRDPAWARLTAPYVAVVASPVRHNERDHDSLGRRIPCPRFGSVTCGEHIAVEPEAFRRWFGGKRFTPRHLGVSPDGSRVLFDRYLDRDLGAVDRALRAHAPKPPGPLPPPGNDKTRLASRDARVRDLCERKFLEASVRDKRRLLRPLLESAPLAANQTELLRLALFDPSPAVQFEIARILAAHPIPALLPLIRKGLDLFRLEKARDLAFDALRKLAISYPAAKREIRTRVALARSTPGFDSRPWIREFRAPRPSAPPSRATDPEALERRLDELAEALRERPKDAALWRENAAANLRFAEDRVRQGLDPRLLLEDARNAAERALRLSPKDPETLALTARILHLSGRMDDAGRRALEALPELREGFAREDRRDLLRLALGALVPRTLPPAEEPEPSLLSRTEGIFLLLDMHPLVENADLLAHASWLRRLGDPRRAEAVALRALDLRPQDPAVHEELRRIALEIRGARGLSALADRLRLRARERAAHSQAKAAPAAQDWFAGLALFLAAEEFRRDREPWEASTAYWKSDALFRASGEAEPSYRDSADHYRSLAHAGLARLALERGDLPTAFAEIRDSLSIRKASAGARDGLGDSPKSLGIKLRAALGRARLLDEERELGRLLDSL